LDSGIDKFYGEYGDWVPPVNDVTKDENGPAPPVAQTASTSFILDTRKLILMLNVLNHPTDKYTQLLDAVIPKYYSTWYQTSVHHFGSPAIQSGIAMAQSVGAIPTSEQDSV